MNSFVVTDVLNSMSLECGGKLKQQNVSTKAQTQTLFGTQAQIAPSLISLFRLKIQMFRSVCKWLFCRKSWMVCNLPIFKRRRMQILYALWKTSHGLWRHREKCDGSCWQLMQRKSSCCWFFFGGEGVYMPLFSYAAAVYCVNWILC